MTTTESSISPGTLLAKPIGDRVDLGADMWGFGGLHGGLTLALLTSAMQAQAPGTRVRSVTAQFHRPIRRAFGIEIARLRGGRALTTLGAQARTTAGLRASASALFAEAEAARPSRSAIGPRPPAAPPPDECEIFTIPTELVPFARYTEIRPVGPNRPMAGGAEPELTAWIRLVEDDVPPDPYRLVVLMDSLAPSYTAVMTTPDPVPTVELTVRPTDALASASSPWVLLQARTRAAGADGWIDERLDAWGPDGAHLGSAYQLRLVVG